MLFEDNFFNLFGNYLIILKINRRYVRCDVKI